MARDRDVTTEACAWAILQLGWPAASTQTERLTEDSLIHAVWNPERSRFALLVDLTEPFAPRTLLVLKEEFDRAAEFVVTQFRNGVSTPVEKLREVWSVNRGLALGPVTL